VTDRMLEMFKRKPDPEPTAERAEQEDKQQ